MTPGLRSLWASANDSYEETLKPKLGVLFEGPEMAIH